MHALPPAPLARFLRGVRPNPAEPTIHDPAWFDAQVAAGAGVAISTSAGKDSSAATVGIVARVPRQQLVMVHADLREVEWPGTLELARAHAAHYGVEFLVARARDKQRADVDFFGRVQREYEKDPSHSPGPRKGKQFCTSDLKRGPIWRVVRGWAEARGFTTVISVQGHRAEESTDRRAMVPIERDPRMSLDDGRREWIDYLPVHAWTEEEVWRVVRASGLGIHPAYLAGARRLSCAFCFYASPADLRVAAIHNPELFGKMVAFEEGHERPEGGHYRLHISRVPLRELVGLSPAQALAQRRHLPLLPAETDPPPRFEVVPGPEGRTWWVWDHAAAVYRPEPFENPDAAETAARALAAGR